MPPKTLPSVPTETEFFAFQGGLHLVTPALRTPAGTLLNCQNYEPDPDGGYRRIGGYERFDGRARPADALYQAIACTLTSTPAAGTSVTIGAATARFVRAIEGGCVLTGVTGTVPAGTSMIIAGPTNIGTTAANLLTPNGITAAQEAQYLVESAAVFRTAITAPTGSGPIRGVWMHGGTVYAFRDNAGGTAGQMWKSSAAGWVQVVLGEEIAFTNANASVNEGDTLTAGGVNATVARVVLESGALGTNPNSGRLIITGRTGGNFAAGAATSTGSGALTLSGAQTPIALSPGGAYQFVSYNFGGQLTSRRMYGCNGLDRAFEFDGTTFVPIATGAATDKPSFLKAHRKYLFVAQGSSLMNSSVGNPYRWVTSEGAAENAVGDTITGLAALPGEALGVTCRNSSQALTGASSATWSMQTIAEDVGAVPGTVATMSDTYMLDDRGVVSVQSTQRYGNFQDATLSRLIQPLIDAIRTKVVGAFVTRQKGHYTLLVSDGSAVVMGTNLGRVTGFTKLQYLFTPNCVASCEDETGVERIFVGAADGFVYELNRGSTFDGAEVEAFVKLAYNNSRSPRVRKAYRKGVLEMTNTLFSAISFAPDFSYGDPDIASHPATVVSAYGAGGVYDLSMFDTTVFYDSQDINQPELPITGTGLNLALFFYSKTRLDHGHVLQGAVVHYTPRRLQR